MLPAILVTPLLLTEKRALRFACDGKKSFE